MGFLVFLAIIYFATKKDRRTSDIFRTFFGISIGITVLGAIFSSAGGILGLIFFIGFIAFLINKSKNGSTSSRDRSDQSTRDTWQQNSQARGSSSYGGSAYSPWQSEVEKSWQKYQQQFGNGNGNYSSGSHRPSGGHSTSGSSSTGSSYGSSSNGSQTSQQSQSYTVSSGKLPRAAKRRKKIVDAFNKRYNLTLDDDEVKRIVDASYISNAWKTEVEAMTEHYDHVNQWLNAPTSWLRVYLYVFELEDISSDFDRQKQIVIQTYKEVFDYAQTLTNMNMDEKIQRVNDRFFTYFDEPNFFMALRFMEQNGYHYDLSHKVDVVQNVSDMDKLKQKYDHMASVYGGQYQQNSDQSSAAQTSPADYMEVDTSDYSSSGSDFTEVEEGTVMQQGEGE